MASDDARPARRVLAAHPSPDLYGSDRQFAESVRGFGEAGWRVDVMLPETGPLAELLEQTTARVHVAATVVLRKSLLSPRGLAGLAWRAPASVLGAVRMIRRLRPDVVYVNTITVPGWIAAARLCRVPAIVHVHEAEEDSSAAVRAGLSAPLLLASSVIANSRASREALLAGVGRIGGRARRRLAARTDVLYNGVARPDGTQGVDPIPGRMAFVGRLSPRKGVDVALEALAQLRAEGRDVSLDVCGTVFAGYEWYEQQLRDRAAQPDLAGAVDFLGYVHPTGARIAAAQAVLVPSRVEPFGNTAVEAQLAGRPVIASDVQGLREIVADGDTGLLVAPDDPMALAAALAKVLDDPAWARDLAAAGRRSAQERFGVEAYRARIAAAVAAVVPAVPVSDALARTGRPQRGASARVADGLVVAVLTFRRVEQIAALAPVLVEQAQRALAAWPDLGRVEVLVVDNDPDASARDALAGLDGIRYVHEPEPGLSAARNRALDEAGDAALLAFIDDDERPAQDWLVSLVGVQRQSGAAAVAGRVERVFPKPLDPWLAAGGFFPDNHRESGAPVPGAGAGNLLLDMNAVRTLALRFHREFGFTGGEDVHFTRELIAGGEQIVWCEEGVVYDQVPTSRMTRRWVLARSFRVGNSDGRSDLALAGSGAQRLRVRATYLGKGAARCAGGSARAAVGAVTRSRRTQALGVRTCVRGAGMLAASVGFRYRAYGRG